MQEIPLLYGEKEYQPVNKAEKLVEIILGAERSVLESGAKGAVLRM